MLKVLFKFILLFMSIVFSNNLNIAEDVNNGYAKMFKYIQKKQSEFYLKKLYTTLNLPIVYQPRQQVFYIVYLYHTIRQACFPVITDKLFLLGLDPYHNNFDDLVSHHILHQQKNWSNFVYYSKYVLNKYTDKVYINTFSHEIFESNKIDFEDLRKAELNLTYIEKVVDIWGFGKNNELNEIDNLITQNDNIEREELEADKKNWYYKFLNGRYGYTGTKYIVTEDNNHFSWPYICSKSLSPTESYSSHAYCILIDAPEEDEKIQGYLKYGFIDSIEKLTFFDASNILFFINLEDMLSVLSDSISLIIWEINNRFYFKGFKYLQFAIFYFVFILVTLRFLYQFFDKGESDYNGFRKYYFLLFIYYIILYSQYSDQDSDEDSDSLILYLYDLVNQISWNIIGFVLELISANSNDSDNIFYNFSSKANKITSTEELKVLCLKELYRAYWISSAIYTVILIIAVVYYCYLGKFQIFDLFNPKSWFNWLIMMQCYGILGLVLITLLDYYFYIYYSFLLSVLISLIPIVIAFDNLPHFNNILRRWFVLVLETIFLFIVFVIMYYALLIFVYLAIVDNLLYSLLQLDLFSDAIVVDMTGFVSAASDPNNMDVNYLVNTILDNDAVDSIKEIVKSANQAGEWLRGKLRWDWLHSAIDWIDDQLEKIANGVVKWIKKLLGPAVVDLLERIDDAIIQWMKALNIEISNVFAGQVKRSLKMVSIMFGFLGLYYIVVYGLFPCESPIKSTIQKFTRQFISDS